MNLTASGRPLVILGSNLALPQVDEETTWRAVAEHGAVLFRDFSASVDQFYEFASRFTREYLKSPFSDRKTASEANELQTVTLGNAGLSLHFEYGTSPLRPDLLWFYCCQAPAPGTGGETLVADGEVIFESLKPKTKSVLENRRITYRNYLPRSAFDTLLRSPKLTDGATAPQAFKALEEKFKFRILEETGNRVVFEFTAKPISVSGPASRARLCCDLFTGAYRRPSAADEDDAFSALATWDNGQDIEVEVLADVRASIRSLTRGIRWRAGDFVVLDNNRMLHGRNHCEDPSRSLVMLSSFSKRFTL